MKPTEEILRKIRTELLQAHINGELSGPDIVLSLVNKHRPESGLDNDSWNSICNFILEIEFANKMPAAKLIAEKYGLELTLQ